MYLELSINNNWMYATTRLMNRLMLDYQLVVARKSHSMIFVADLNSILSTWLESRGVYLQNCHFTMWNDKLIEEVSLVEHMQTQLYPIKLYVHNFNLSRTMRRELWNVLDYDRSIVENGYFLGSRVESEVLDKLLEINNNQFICHRYTKL